LASVLALIGVPPFSIFMSELWIARAGIEKGHIFAVVMFFITTAIIAVAMFRSAIQMTWNKPNAAAPSYNTAGLHWSLVVLPSAFLLAVGVWMPQAFRDVLSKAALIMGGP
jgi:hydrogenase-4 component F